MDNKNILLLLSILLIFIIVKNKNKDEKFTTRMIIPNIEIIPKNDENYMEMEKKFEKKIGKFPDPSECVIL